MDAHSRDEVERIVRQYVDSYGSKDKAKNMEVIHPEHAFGFPEMSLVDPSFEQVGRAMHELAWDGDTDFLLDLRTRIDQLYVDGDTAITVGRLTGSQVGTNPMTGDGPKVCVIDTPYTAVWEIEDHTIKRVRWYYDLVSLYVAQLGMDPVAMVNAFTEISAGMAASTAA